MTNIKRERFVKVAAARVTKTLEMLRLLKNCSNRANYDYTEQDVDQMFAEIDKVLCEAREAYDKGLSKNKSYKFTFMENKKSVSSLFLEDIFLGWLVSPDNPKRLALESAESYVSNVKSVNKKLFCKTGYDMLAMLPGFVETGNAEKIDEMFEAMDGKLTERISEKNEAEMPLGSLNNARTALRRYAEFVKSINVTE